MIRLLIFVLVVLGLGAGFAWLADRPGDLVINWQGQQIEMALTVAVAFIVALVAAVLILWWLIRTLVTSPHLVRRHLKARKRDRGYQALSTGLIAAGAGDAVTARKMNKRTRGLLSARQEPLIHLLEAQTALIEGDHAAARAKFESMAEDPETRDLALRGLYLEARRLGEEEAARQYAERAVDSAPQLPWAAQASLEFRSREGDWDGALRLLEKQRMARIVKRDEGERKKAVLLTARAMQRLDGDARGARDDALEAVRLAPDLVPAAVTAAKALFREDNLRRGTKILEKAWKSKPHPEIAETYVRARIGDSVLDRLKRAEKLEALKPNHIESLLAVAHAALDAQQFDRARQKAEAAARQESRESTYLLLADIEEAETDDQGRVRHWLSQAVRAGRDPVWAADGYVSEKWAPVSPVTGKLDAFVWRVPVSQLVQQPTHDADAGDSQAETAIRTLPPLRKEVEAPRGVGDGKPVTVEAETVDEPTPRRAAPAEPVAAADEAAVAGDATGKSESAGGSPEHGADAKPAATASAGTSGPAEKPAGAPIPEGGPAGPLEPAEGDEKKAAPDDTATAKPVPQDVDARKPAEAEDSPDKVNGAGRRSKEPERESAPFRRPPDDPGVEPETPAKPKFRLF